MKTTNIISQGFVYWAFLTFVMWCNQHPHSSLSKSRRQTSIDISDLYYGPIIIEPRSDAEKLEPLGHFWHAIWLLLLRFIALTKNTAD